MKAFFTNHGPSSTARMSLNRSRPKAWYRCHKDSKGFLTQFCQKGQPPFSLQHKWQKSLFHLFVFTTVNGAVTDWKRSKMRLQARARCILELTMASFSKNQCMQCRQRIYQIWVEDLELARLLLYIGGLKGTQDNQRLQAKTTMQCPENVARRWILRHLPLLCLVAKSFGTKHRCLQA